MLVLTRRVEESVVIAGEIVVTVLAVHGNHVRLGIAAPASVQIDRAEVRERKLAGASNTGAPSVLDPGQRDYAESIRDVP